MKEFLEAHWKEILVVLTAVLIAVGILLWSHSRTKAPEVVNVPSVDTNTLRNYFPKDSASEIKDMSHQMTRAKETQAPSYHYYTYNQNDADRQAQAYAKDQKADRLIKETQVIKVVEPSNNGKSSTTNQEEEKDATKPSGVIENNYYAINLERKHKVKAGGAYIDDKAYASITYQNRDVEYTAYYSPQDREVGAGVSVTIAKW